MTTVRRGIAILTGVIALIATMMTGSLITAHEGHEHGTPAAHGGQMMATPGMSGGMTGTGVVYMTITNDGDTDAELVSATTDRAELGEIHEMRVTDDIGVMVPHEGPLVIPAGESVSLEPGGLHVMLIGLTDDIRLGDTFDLTLAFADAGEVTIPVTAVLDAEDAGGEPVTVDDLVIDGVWSRPAPRIDGIGASTPVSTPAS